MNQSDAEDIKQALAKLQKSNEQVVLAIKGNPLTNDGGIIGRIKEIEESHETLQDEIVKIQDNQKRVGWMIAGGLAAGGFVFAVVKVVIENVFKF
jgi:hypothetical protein